MVYCQCLVSLIYNPNLNTRIWDNNPSQSIDLEKKNWVILACVSISFMQGMRILHWHFCSRQRNTTTVSQAACEKIISDVMWFTHFRSFPMCPWGRMLMESLIVWSIHIKVIKGLQSQKSTTYCGLPLYMSGNMTQTNSLYK